ncbi:facilitated trehalose transporter Tret1-2 homolog [Tribolium castaneum]|uniref:Facilitated trehalose transporter Tret1-2 homolog-like Protein n=1 Tax=Tribolium castaneum TaxID=7070 RepID=D6WU24_TRICA|nr:PREDICTED: facilitated trehalose transporter Tret1-2 homolog [Tribolium castaneum]EFA06748.1 Facilitated trehalose transporter Tret1-2 homolog-like Protein [Tribolium castaneum]|eukprot:XP_966913.1 PREDICTED: facilitated trehalose transporter Tret1-2 homolog [Tribolium castaneum]
MTGSVTVKNFEVQEDRDEKGGDWYQILAIFLSCISAFNAGMLFSWSSPSIPKISEDKVNYDISLDEASYFTVLPPMGAICSCFVFSKLTDMIGRKHTLILIAIPQIVSLVLISVAKSVYVFYIARFLAGVADACLFASLPIYVAEITTPKVRGTWGNFMTFLIYIGQLTINIVGSYTSVVMTAYICLIFPVFFLCTFIFMPETPYYYLIKNRTEDARLSLRKLRRKQDVEEELNKLKADVARQMSESATWRDVFTIVSNRKAVYAGVFLRASQQLGGISSFAVYTQYIFLKSGGDVSASTSSIIFMGLCAALNMCAGFTLDRIGRRRSYFLSLLLCGSVLLCEAVYFILEQFYGDKVDVQVVNWIPLVGMILYVIFYSFGLGIVPTLMLGELFSASIKGKGLFVLNIVFALLVSGATKLFHILDTSFGLFAPFLFFSVSCFLSAILALYFVPETKGKTLEEIQQSLKGRKQQDKQPC